MRMRFHLFTSQTWLSGRTKFVTCIIRRPVWSKSTDSKDGFSLGRREELNMAFREQANEIVEKIKKYQEDNDGWKPAKNSVSKKDFTFWQLHFSQSGDE